jgi:hypothetical protein
MEDLNEIKKTIDVLQTKSQQILAKQLEAADCLLGVETSTLDIKAMCLLIDTLSKLNNESLVPMTIKLIEILLEKRDNDE